MQNKILLFFTIFFLTGCGYKPVSHIARDVMGGNVYVDVIIDKRDPKNSVWIKDGVREGIVSRLNKKLSDDKNADTTIVVAMRSLTLEPLLYDDDGYATSYKAVVTLEFDTKFKDATAKNVITTGEYDFAVSQKIKNVRYADSVLSDTQRYNAIKEASREAFDEYIAVIAMQGYDKRRQNVD